MAAPGAVEVALFAFRKRERRFVLTATTASYFILAALLAIAYVAATWGVWGGLIGWYIETLRAIMAGGEPSPPNFSTLGWIAPWALGHGLIGLILFAAYEAACLRWLVRGERGGGVFGLTLGADTWRVFAIYWLWILLLVVFVVGVIGVYFGIHALAEVAGPFRILVLLIAALTPLGLLAAMIFGAVRLAPGAALTIARGRFAFFEAWGATRGHFWPLLGGFFLVSVCYFVVATIVGQLFQASLQTALAPIMAAVLQGADADRVLALARENLWTPTFATLGLFYLVVNSIITAVFYVAYFGVNGAVIAGEPAPSS